MNDANRDCPVCQSTVYPIADLNGTDHLVIIEKPMTFDHTTDGDTVKVVASQDVGLAKCSDLKRLSAAGKNNSNTTPAPTTRAAQRQSTQQTDVGNARPTRMGHTRPSRDLPSMRRPARLALLDMAARTATPPTTPGTDPMKLRVVSR